MNFIDLPPFAPVLMESTRAMGYRVEDAIADIIDNSIAAKADIISISFSPYELVPYVSILDNGEGMSDDKINDAMRYGSQSSLLERDSSDLGRFGLGLKTASLSQCRCLTVISKQGDNVVARRWDLDEIYRIGTWALICLSDEDLEKIPLYETQLKHLENGTLVIWEKLDRMLNGTTTPEKLMSKHMEQVREHISLVFHRYLEGEAGIRKIAIEVNKLAVEPKDPFLIGRSTVFQAEEKLHIDGHPVHVSTYILPHISNLTRNEKASLGGNEGLTKNQGFYIYRNYRLLVWGTWFRMHRKDELSKLARIKVDVPNVLDHLWTLDIRKSTAHPPEIIKNNLASIVDRISEGSKRAWTFRGKREISDTGSHLWSKTKSREGIVYNLNREHMIYKLLSDNLDGQKRKLLQDYLKLIEENLPLNQLYVDINNDESINIRNEKDTMLETMEMARNILKNINGDRERNAQINLLMQTDPFCKYREVVDLLIKELNDVKSSFI